MTYPTVDAPSARAPVVPAPCHVDLHQIQRIALRAAPIRDDSGQHTLWQLLDELVMHPPLNRPLIVAKAIARLGQSDPDSARLIKSSGLIDQLRMEITHRQQAAASGGAASGQQAVRTAAASVGAVPVSSLSSSNSPHPHD